MESNSLFWSETDRLVSVAHSLKQGGVVLSSTDTVLGLLAVAQESGLQSLNHIKGREQKPYIVLISSLDDLKGLAKLPLADSVQRLVAVCWPGPVTLVLPALSSLPSWLVSAQGTIAIRLPDHAGLRFLAHACGPLFSTSANHAGKPVPRLLGEVDQSILDAVSYVMSDQLTREALASTLLDCTGSDIRLLREGVFQVAQIEKRAGISIVR